MRERAPGHLGTSSWLATLTLLAASLLAGALPAGARPKTDIVVLQNGDRLHGEIKLLDKGQLTLSTDAASKIQIEWDWVVSATSEYFYEVELDTGVKYFGTLKPVREKGMIRVVGMSGATLLTRDEVVRLTPIKRSFWGRFNGSITLSLAYTQANNLIQWNGSGNLSYRTRKWYSNLSGSTFLSKQDDAGETVRNEIGLAVTRYLPKKKLWSTSLTLNENPDQGFSLRAVLSTGLGVFLIQENSQTLSVGLSLAVNRETPIDTSAVSTTMEIELPIALERFSYQHPKRNLTANLTPSVNLQEKGRYRVQLNVQGKWEMVSDFYFSVTLAEAYDSRPPTEGAAKNDFSITTGLSYSF